MEISITEIRDNLADALNRVAYGGERVVLRRHSKGVAALVSMDDLALLEEMENRADLIAARKALAEGGRPIPLEEVLAKQGLAGKRRRSRAKVKR